MRRVAYVCVLCECGINYVCMYPIGAHKGFVREIAFSEFKLYNKFEKTFKKLRCKFHCATALAQV